MTTTVSANCIDTPQYQDQKAGTSGLRKPTKTFLDKKNYLDNYVQATLTAVSATPDGMPKTLVVGGDGRFYCPEACQIILKIAAANGVEHVIVGQNALLSTPAVSALVRRHPAKPDGAFILTASHNPGGPNGDFGIKYNGKNGGPAQESLTGKIFDETKAIVCVKKCEALPEVDLSQIAECSFTVSSSSSSSSADGQQTNITRPFKVSVVDSVADYAALMQECFDFPLLKKLFARPDFTFCFDALNGIGGPYGKKIFVDLLGAPADKSVKNCDPKPDFGGLHPDPNLTYAEQLVKIMGLTRTGAVAPPAGETAAAPEPPTFGAAADGDADRNMILGRRFFVTPSDSVAVIAANAQCIPFFARQGGLKSVARSMPTSAALDRVAKELKLNLFEVPTGWKFFGNLMDSDVLFGQEKYTPLLCGEESFGTGSDHVREKDGIWAVLAWLSIIAQRADSHPEKKLVSVEDIVSEHWRKFGRNYYARLDYEGVESDKADAMMAHLRALTTDKIGPIEEAADVSDDGSLTLPAVAIKSIDDFCYVDPVDKSTSAKQGIRVVFQDGSRFVFRLSGTGSSGATIRLYCEAYVDAETVAKLQGGGDFKKAMPPTMKMLGRIIKSALATSKLPEFTGRNEPTVIT